MNHPNNSCQHAPGTVKIVITIVAGNRAGRPVGAKARAAAALAEKESLLLDKACKAIMRRATPSATLLPSAITHMWRGLRNKELRDAAIGHLLATRQIVELEEVRGKKRYAYADPKIGGAQ